MIQWDMNGIYPLVNIQKAIEAMAIEIVDLPTENGGSFHSYLSLPEGIPISPHISG